MKFIVIASYSKQGTDGWLDNPDDDRRTMISAMMERIGGSLHDLVYCREVNMMLLQRLKHLTLTV